MKKRLFAILLCLCLAMSLLPCAAFADGDGAGDSTLAVGTESLCEHHTAHDGSCGYIAGTPCTHVCSVESSCITQVTKCTHVHTADCYSGGQLPAEGEEKTADACAHECSVESGCIVQETKCIHEHDESCGYSAGSPCTYVCEICKAAPTGENSPSENDKCICTEKCSQDNINKDCPVCSAQGADLAALCLGESPAPLSTQLATPTNLRWVGFTAVWDAVANGGTYNLVIYGQTLGSYETTVNGTVFELGRISDKLSEGETYTFTVQALPSPGDSAHTESQISGPSGGSNPWSANTVTVTVSAEPAGKGEVTGGGKYNVGDPVSLTAQTAEPNVFAGWYNRVTGVWPSTTSEYTFEAKTDADLAALFLVPVEISGYTGSVVSSPGKSATFKVEVVDYNYSFDTLSYQWALSTDGGQQFSDIPGATQAEYTVDNVTDVMNGNLYRCTVTRSLVTVSDTEAVTCTLYTAAVDRPQISLDRNRVSLGGTETLNFTLPEGFSLSSVTAGGKALTESTDYGFAYGNRNQLILSNSFLSSLPLGSTTLSFRFDGAGDTPVNLSSTITVPDCWVVDIKADPEGESGAWIEEYYSYMSTVYVPKGESVQLECVPWGYYEFEGWVENGQTISTDYVFNFVPSGNTSLTMVCRKLNIQLSASKSGLDFGSVYPGYTRPAAQTVTITNTGEIPLNLVLPVNSAYDIKFAQEILSGESSIQLGVGQSVAVSVQPKAGLGVGCYNATLVFSGEDPYWTDPVVALSLSADSSRAGAPVLAGAAVDVKFTVKAYDSSTPKTGDSSNLGLWLGLMGLSVLVIGGGAVFYVIKKKKK